MQNPSFSCCPHFANKKQLTATEILSLSAVVGVVLFGLVLVGDSHTLILQELIEARMFPAIC